ncbi:NAD(P)-dependent oxidoreductase [Tessaracoccus defluvii]|uniref:Phosphoglycerate dehydrogenase n=1 Tax=Tessaracoccus defluvii TaxID=1285901 RepID=A0A7H0H6J1_9ACTN|nr:NAD(P)-dependent oxidoreductase [Tessaracoccus defluvii]QNP56157.1 phosphoglycerate dehydrogenase [Tessaracoccus defluvii]
MKIVVPDAYVGPSPVVDGAEVVHVPAKAAVPDEHLDAEVLVAWGQPGWVLADAAARMPRLRLVQGLMAGPDLVLGAGFADDVALCSGVGGHDGTVTQHALGLTLALVRNFPLAFQRMQERRWDGSLGGAMRDRAHDGRITGLDGARVAVWGFGSIAATLSPVLTALGAEVTGIARTAGERHGYPVVAEDDIAELLAATDVLIMILPGNESTRHALNAERLAQLAPGALLVNVGRGITVDQEALEAALRSGRLAGAAIDVTEPEPLPSDSPLWDLPTLFITPHVAGGRPQHADRLIADNVAALEAGTPLRNRLR